MKSLFLPQTCVGAPLPKHSRPIITDPKSYVSCPNPTTLGFRMYLLVPTDKPHESHMFQPRVALSPHPLHPSSAPPRSTPPATWPRSILVMIHSMEALVSTSMVHACIVVSEQMAQSAKRWFIYGSPSKRHLRVCTLYSQTTVVAILGGLAFGSSLHWPSQGTCVRFLC